MKNNEDVELHTIELSPGELNMIEIALRVWREQARSPNWDTATSLVLIELILKMADKNSAIMSSDPEWVNS
jgi:hypothetical protein